MSHLDPYRQQIDSELAVISMEGDHAPQLEELQELVFPDLAPEERFRAEHYRHHLRLFPEGQFVAIAGERVVGMTTTIRLDFDFADADRHTFAEVIAGGYLTSHDPEGLWMYGLDVGTHPDFRRRGIARGLYRARQGTVRALGLLGQVTVGMLNGYRDHAASMTIDEYYLAVVAGRLEDPTVSAQRRVGFEIRGLIKDYLNDPTCGNAGALLVLSSETPL